MLAVGPGFPLLPAPPATPSSPCKTNTIQCMSDLLFLTVIINNISVVTKRDMSV